MGEIRSKTSQASQKARVVPARTRRVAELEGFEEHEKLVQGSQKSFGYACSLGSFRCGERL